MAALPYRKPVPPREPALIGTVKSTHVVGAKVIDASAENSPFDLPSMDSIQGNDKMSPDLDALGMSELGFQVHELESDCDDVDLGTITDNPVLPQQLASGKHQKLKGFLDEAKHFAGGLISHPYEAMGNFAILRHSHGIVFYQGPTMRVTITVISNQSLPANRRVWLQKRGFSGNMGLKVGASLGNRKAWIDVTPAVEATIDLLPETDERAWQRDINKLLKAARPIKGLQHLRPIETNLIRIPHSAEDGYFRVVICEGRKVLCPSPVFRYASSSTDPSILRGASLLSVPVELGIKIGSYVANGALHNVVHSAISPAINAHRPGMVTQAAASFMYSASGAQQKVDNALGMTNSRDQDVENPSSYRIRSNPIDIVDVDGGPIKPFPMKFSGKIGKAFNLPLCSPALSIIRRIHISDDLMLRLDGLYCGWTSVARANISGDDKDVQTKWVPSIFVVGVDSQQEIKVVTTKAMISVLLQDLVQDDLTGCKIKIMLMAFLRKLEYAEGELITEPSIEAAHKHLSDEIEAYEKVLAHPAWAAEPSLQRIKTDSSSRSISQRAADAHQAGLRYMNRSGIHKFGIRTDGMKIMDELIGTGGVWVRR